ncbi:hypothetical protein FSP39_023217 [Pinctada imbricata]|uniref:Major facilitator superfamily (MFS) profile domain-containing protein n=1 Tax=Pinctada imbricata TaxID=66713 RepID=A0AA88YS65_PINIB|nr:hypothetical protein FSP39_023217 [Pinctada imbricata]
MVPDIAREQGISKDSIALMVTLSGLSSIAARVIFGFVSDFSWWNRMVANGISLIILGAATSTVHLFNVDYFFFLYTILLGIVTGEKSFRNNYIKN